MPSPASLEQHAEPQAILVGWFFNYWANTPRLRLGDNATLRLGPEDDPQPDVLLMIPAALGGRARVDPGGYVSGPPELVAEVSASTVSYDLHVKLDLYRERGVREYLVWRVRDREVDWFVLRDSAYERLAAGTDGVLRSEVFPGLWLDPGALVTADPARLLAVLQKGLATPEHAAFRKALLAHA
jgi:Uma2 family endonuclease